MTEWSTGRVNMQAMLFQTEKNTVFSRKAYKTKVKSYIKVTKVILVANLPISCECSLSLPPENTSRLQNLFDALSVYRHRQIQAIFKAGVPVWASKLRYLQLVSPIFLKFIIHLI